MNKQDDKSDIILDPDGVPGWLFSALRDLRDLGLFSNAEEDSSEAPADFYERCQNAAIVAHGLAALRKERQRIGFVPLSLSEYIQGLIKITGVSIASILAWVGVKELTYTDASTLKALAHLARAIGLSLQETLLHARIGFAAQFGSAPVSLLIARRRAIGPRPGPVQECENALQHIESEYDLNRVRELSQLEAEVRAAYKKSDSMIF